MHVKFVYEVKLGHNRLLYVERIRESFFPDFITKASVFWRFSATGKKTHTKILIEIL